MFPMQDDRQCPLRSKFVKHVPIERVKGALRLSEQQRRNRASKEILISWKSSLRLNRDSDLQCSVLNSMVASEAKKAAVFNKTKQKGAYLLRSK